MSLRIIFLPLFLFLSLDICGLHGNVVSADQEFFPFLAEATSDRVNVRSGQSASFERLCQLDKGDEVVVVEKEFSWYKIQLPPSAKSFVNKEYVQFLGRNAGGVVADRVNVRAGAGTQYTILGQLARGEQIYIQEELDEWYRIHPVANSYGWVSDQFLAFKSNDIVRQQAVLSSESSIKEEVQEEPQEEPKEGLQEELQEEPQKKLQEEPPEEGQSEEEEVKEAVEAEAEAEDVEIFSVIGYVEPHEDEKNDDIHYKIIVNGRPVCYIQGLNHMLGRFLHHRVAVEGIVNQKLQSQYAHPVVIVSRVRLML